jgi:Family of unknown function (DUF6188)
LRLEEKTDGYQVVLGDAQVTQVLLDYRLGITILDNDNDWLKLVIASMFSTRDGGPDVPTALIHPEKATSDLGALAVTLRFQRLSKCYIAKDGTLTLGFESGLTITVPPDAHYEAWDLDHKLFKVIAMPGGELAIWDKPQGEKPQTT